MNGEATVLIEVDRLVVVVPELASPEALSGLHVQRWDDGVRLLDHEHDSKGTAAPYDEQDAPEASPIKFLGHARSSVTQRLMRARRKEVGVKPRSPSIEPGAHLQDSPHVHASVHASNQRGAPVNADGDFAVLTLVKRACDGRELPSADADGHGMLAIEEASEVAGLADGPNEEGQLIRDTRRPARVDVGECPIATHLGERTAGHLLEGTAKEIPCELMWRAAEGSSSRVIRWALESEQSPKVIVREG